MIADSHFGCPFGTVAIVGVGLIGGSLGMALKARRLARHVVGVGRDPARLETAVRLGAIDDFEMEGTASLREADIIVLCTTVRHIEQTLPDILALARPGALVTDVGSTKSVIVARAGGAANFVGGHPMAGSEKGGVEAATPTLFQEATWALTPTPATDPDALLTIQTLAQEVGATTRIFTPEAHDAMVAVTSHVPHVLASALMRLAARTRAEYLGTPALAAGSFADMTRVAASSPELWRDVCLTNREAVQDALAGFRVELAALEAALDAQDADALAAFFRAGAAAKSEWPPRSS
jgi:prephenate dehydrogenase